MKKILIILYMIMHSNTIALFAQEWMTMIQIDTTALITSIGETNRFIWIGTTKGLYRINKGTYRHALFTQQNSRLPHSHVTSIACNAEGQTYVGTKEGILFWDNYAFLPLTTDNSALQENHITALAFDSNGDLWIATLHYGICKGVGRDIKPYKYQCTFSQNESKLPDLLLR